MAEVEIVLPAVDDDALSDALRLITAAIDQSRGEAGGFGLGGRSGYGAVWDSAVFAMHPYCWCERDECPWCRGCSCGDNTWAADITTPAGVKCSWCSGEVRDAEYGSISPNEPPHAAAPNFWHKPTGLRVWWYKYIGRGMETHGAGDVSTITTECLTEIQRLRMEVE